MMTVLWALCAAVVLGSALVVVSSRDLVRSVLALGVTLAGTAGLYGLLDAPYLAAVQLLLYVGGVVTVMVFGVLLTRRAEGDDGQVVVERGRVVPAFLGALVVGGILLAGILASAPAGSPASTLEPARSVGARFVTEHLLAFEIVSAVLLAAMVGAIVLVRRDPGRRPS
jgi:NADH:ubiquinone oxidoreductase subunit 6 (subunit J)